MKTVWMIPGLCCTAEILKPLQTALKAKLGAEFSLKIIDLIRNGPQSTDGYMKTIHEQASFSEEDIVLGYSMGGQLANLLAASGVVKNVILLSPSMPSDWLQIDPRRLGIFGRQLFSNKPFVFDAKIARTYILQGVDDGTFSELMKHWHNEDASFIREYALRKSNTKIGGETFHRIKDSCKGIVITGMKDIICKANLQSELAGKLGFEQILLDSGHAPHLDHNAERTVLEISNWILRTSKSSAKITAKAG